MTFVIPLEDILVSEISEYGDRLVEDGVDLFIAFLDLIVRIGS